MPQTLLQGQKSFTRSHFGIAPPGMSQHQLEQPVPVGPAADGYSQGIAVGEVDLGLAPRRMLLGEVDLLLRTVKRPPVL